MLKGDSWVSVYSLVLGWPHPLPCARKERDYAGSISQPPVQILITGCKLASFPSVVPRRLLSCRYSEPAHSELVRNSSGGAIFAVSAKPPKECAGLTPMFWLSLVSMSETTAKLDSKTAHEIPLSYMRSVN